MTAADLMVMARLTEKQIVPNDVEGLQRWHLSRAARRDPGEGPGLLPSR